MLHTAASCSRGTLGCKRGVWDKNEMRKDQEDVGSCYFINICTSFIVWLCRWKVTYESMGLPEVHYKAPRRAVSPLECWGEQSDWTICSPANNCGLKYRGWKRFVKPRKSDHLCVFSEPLNSASWKTAVGWGLWNRASQTIYAPFQNREGPRFGKLWFEVVLKTSLMVWLLLWLKTSQNRGFLAVLSSFFSVGSRSETLYKYYTW